MTDPLLPSVAVKAVDFHYVFASYTDPGAHAFAVTLAFSTDDIAVMDKPPFNGRRRFEQQLNMEAAAALGFTMEDICEKLSTDVALQLTTVRATIGAVTADRDKAESDLVDERTATAQAVRERDEAVAGLQSEIEELRAAVAELEARVKEEQVATATAQAGILELEQEIEARG